MQKYILGISGKIGTGKTTIAGHLQRLLASENYVAEKFSFGDALKREVSRVFGVPLVDLYSQEGKAKSCTFEIDGFSRTMTLRELLQWYGTDHTRAQWPSYWVDRLAEEISDSSCRVAIIDDIRFVDEAEYAAKSGRKRSLLLRLEPYAGWTCGPSVAAHESETALDGYTFRWRITPQFGELDEIAQLLLPMIRQELRG